MIAVKVAVAVREAIVVKKQETEETEEMGDKTATVDAILFEKPARPEIKFSASLSTGV